MPKLKNKITAMDGTESLIPAAEEGFNEADNAYNTLSSYYDYGQGKLSSRNPVYYLADKMKRLMGNKYPSEVGTWSYPTKTYKSQVPENLNPVIYPKSEVPGVLGEFTPGKNDIMLFQDTPERVTDTAAHELIHSMGYRETPSRGKGYHDADANSLMAPINPEGSNFRQRMQRYLQRAQDNIKRSDQFPFPNYPQGEE